MVIENIDLGTPNDDQTGDDLRTASGKINAKFAEVLADIAAIHAGDETRLAGIEQAIASLEGRVAAIEPSVSINFSLKNVAGEPVIATQDGTLTITVESGVYGGT